MAVYGYVRVSTIQQADHGDSLEAQIKQVTSYAASRGLVLPESGIFVERGVSGGSEFANRPEGSRLLSAISSGDVLILSKLDRGFRNLRDALGTLHLLKERGVIFCCLDLGGEVSGSGVGSILFAVMGAFADFERSRIASRISEVKQMRKAQGFYVGGRRGFGFDVVDGKKVANDAEQALLDQMKSMRQEGSSLRAIHEWLNNEQSVKLAYSSLRMAMLNDRQ